MNGAAPSGFMRAVDLLSFIAALMAAFVWLPEADAATRTWVIPHILTFFGRAHLGWLLLCWQGLLGLLIFAAIRSGLGLALSMLGLIIALIIAALFGRGPKS